MAVTRASMTDEEWAFLRNIGEMYKDLRVDARMTQYEAADAYGTSQATVSYLERGTSDIMITTLNRWANLYGYEVQVQLVPIEDEFDKALREAVEELDMQTKEE